MNTFRNILVTDNKIYPREVEIYVTAAECECPKCVASGNYASPGVKFFTLIVTDPDQHREDLSATSQIILPTIDFRGGNGTRTSKLAGSLGIGGLNSPLLYSRAIRSTDPNRSHFLARPPGQPESQRTSLMQKILGVREGHVSTKSRQRTVRAHTPGPWNESRERTT